MKDNRITLTQAMISILLFNFGSSVIMGVSTDLAQEAWVAILLAAVLAIPLFCIYSRIIRLFPEKNLFEIVEILFGKIASKILNVFIIWYAIHLCALVLRNFSEFTYISSMPETPQLAIMAIMILTTIYFAKSGMRVVGKWSISVFYLIFFVVISTFLLSASHIKLDSFLPVFAHTPSEYISSTSQMFSYPFAETVVFLCVADYFHKKNNPYKMFLYGLILTFIIFILVFVRNFALLGDEIMRINYFPSYMAVRLIEIGDFFARIEGSISSNFALAGIVKITVCLLAASKGVSHLFNLQSYKPVVMPVGMIVMALCAIMYNNTMEMFAFIEIYPYYAVWFQAVIPIVVWISGEIYTKKHKKLDSCV